VGCAALVIDLPGRRGSLGEHKFAEGDWLTLDGDDGSVYAGQRKTVEERPDIALSAIERWRV